MPDETYAERRQRLKAAIDRSPIPMTELVKDLDYSYAYIANIVSAQPGAKSGPVLDALETALEEYGILAPATDMQSG